MSASGGVSGEGPKPYPWYVVCPQCGEWPFQSKPKAMAWMYEHRRLRSCRQSYITDYGMNDD